MKTIVSCLAMIILLTSTSCWWMGNKQIKGNGIIITQDREVKKAQRIRLSGSFEVEITQGPETSVKVEADENIQPFIFVSEKDGQLVIRTKEHVTIKSANPVKIIITSSQIDEVHLAGSGKITGKNKFTGSNKFILSISGSGDAIIDINTPEINANISGSGTIRLTGETQKETIKISGVGDVYAEEMKSENAIITISGSGEVKAFADVSMDVRIAGSGSVYYKGAATVKQHVSGSGEVKKIE